MTETFAGIILLAVGACGLGVLVTLVWVFGTTMWWGENDPVQPPDPYTEKLRGSH